MRNILVIGISLFLLTAGIALAGKPQSPEPPAAAAGNMELIGFTTATTAMATPTAAKAVAENVIWPPDA